MTDLEAIANIAKSLLARHGYYCHEYHFNDVDRRGCKICGPLQEIVDAITESAAPR